MLRTGDDSYAQSDDAGFTVVHSLPCHAASSTRLEISSISYIEQYLRSNVKPIFP
jgi:hypothetical protein